jgi:hypothetical protein
MQTSDVSLAYRIFLRYQIRPWALVPDSGASGTLIHCLSHLCRSESKSATVDTHDLVIRTPHCRC